MGDDVFGFNPAELEAFVQEYMGLDRRVQRPKGIYSILPGPREEKYQYTLQYFLDPRQPHGFGSTLLDSFLERIGFPEFNLARQHVEIADEVWIADDGLEGRIDLVICGGSALGDHPRWRVS
ncbi:PD-(D/E)XK nuclease family protein [Halobacterium sp. KA-4]|uniref:PD-(D/E)XK nuclease family protein n=1 Tax=Halobacterium sp. KA-4 TaxID=2896367 RepID=UPI001E325849|nr:PD-(D/E)XK nuclease family protein [Halobacterium sp. KA-4]MCD2201327.1 PD-(D/E)XK nuclease family protein [Halobacterium sp. KA-4]